MQISCYFHIILKKIRDSSKNALELKRKKWTRRGQRENKEGEQIMPELSVPHTLCATRSYTAVRERLHTSLGYLAEREISRLVRVTMTR